MELRRKRAYDTAEPSDGFRVLVDRLWPRGVSKEEAAIDLWAKDVSPTTELRHAWHAAAPEDQHIYEDQYRAQLAGPSADALHTLVDELKPHPVVTLVYASRNTVSDNAEVLEEVLQPLLE